MKLEDQVCSLKLAKKLKELGVKQESIWYWIGKDIHLDDELKMLKEKHGSIYKVYSAFTVAELEEMLPNEVNGYFLRIWKWLFKWEVVYCYHIEGKWNFLTKDFHLFASKTEANVRAKMLIYLIENKLIKYHKK